MKISLENITHGTRAYMQDGKVNFKPSKEMECGPCSKMTKQAKTPIKRNTCIHARWKGQLQAK